MAKKKKGVKKDKGQQRHEPPSSATTNEPAMVVMENVVVTETPPTTIMTTNNDLMQPSDNKVAITTPSDDSSLLPSPPNADDEAVSEKEIDEAKSKNSSPSPRSQVDTKATIEQTKEEVPVVVSDGDGASSEKTPVDTTAAIEVETKTATRQNNKDDSKMDKEDSTSPRTVVVEEPNLEKKETVTSTTNDTVVTKNNAPESQEAVVSASVESSKLTETKDETTTASPTDAMKSAVVITTTTSSGETSSLIAEPQETNSTAINNDIPMSPKTSDLPAGAHKPAASLIATKQAALFGESHNNNNNDDNVVPISPTKRNKLAIPATFLAAASPTKQVIPKEKLAIPSMSVVEHKPQQATTTTATSVSAEPSIATKNDDATDNSYELEKTIATVKVETIIPSSPIKDPISAAFSAGNDDEKTTEAVSYQADPKDTEPSTPKKLAIPALFEKSGEAANNKTTESTSSLAALISPVKRSKNKITIPAAFAGGATGKSEVVHKSHAGDLAGVPHKKASAAPYTYTETAVATTGDQTPVKSSSVTPTKKLAIPAVFADHQHDVDHPPLTMTEKTNPIVPPTKKLEIPSALTGEGSKQSESESPSTRIVVHQLAIPAVFTEKSENSPVPQKESQSSAAGSQMAIGAPPLTTNGAASGEADEKDCLVEKITSVESQISATRKTLVEEATKAAAAAQEASAATSLEKIVNDQHKEEIIAGIRDKKMAQTNAKDAGPQRGGNTDQATSTTPKGGDGTITGVGTHPEAANASCCSIL